MSRKRAGKPGARPAARTGAAVRRVPRSQGLHQALTLLRHVGADTAGPWRPGNAADHPIVMFEPRHQVALGGRVSAAAPEPRRQSGVGDGDPVSSSPARAGSVSRSGNAGIFVTLSGFTDPRRESPEPGLLARIDRPTWTPGHCGGSFGRSMGARATGRPCPVRSRACPEPSLGSDHPPRTYGVAPSKRPGVRLREHDGATRAGQASVGLVAAGAARRRGASAHAG